MADALLDDDSGTVRRLLRSIRARDANGYAAELEQWLRRVEVPPLHMLLLQDRVSLGQVTWMELPLGWRPVRWWK